MIPNRFCLALTVLMVGALAPIAPVSAQSSGTLWSAAAGGNDHRYEAVYVPEGITWTAARDAATLKGGYLASITSAEENGFIFSLITDVKFWPVSNQGFYFGPWLGGYQPNSLNEPGGGWAWLSGEAWSYTNWAIYGPINPQPDNWLGVENYLGLLSYGPIAPFWNDHLLDPRDHPLGGAVNAYIVEYEPHTDVPEPATLILLSTGMVLLLMRKLRRGQVV